MKPVKFDYTLPPALMAVPALLTGQERVSKVVSGGQSLGAMLNLRLVQPDVLLDISGLAELKRIQETRDAWVIGACITHANIEDGCIAGKVGEVLASIARGIAYRAVRNRGTIGGSLAHADPSADWLCTLMALNTTIRLVGEAGARTLALDKFVTAAYEVDLAEDELIESVAIPKLSETQYWGYSKICRKTGEFAHAMAAVMRDTAKGNTRLVLGATERSPLVIAGPDDMLLESGDRFRVGVIERALSAHGVIDPIGNQIRVAACQRALKKSFGIASR